MPEIFGKQVSKGTLWIGGGAAGLLGIALYRYRKQQQAAAATAAANAAAQAPGTGLGTSDAIDPATGFPYGSTEDAAAMTAQAGYNSPIGGLGYSDIGYNYGGGGFYPGSGGGPVGGGFTSNAQWSQAAEAYLVGQGADANTVGNALGKYITGGVINDPTATSIVNQAIAFEGYPPVPGPNGFPPSIQTGPTGVGNTPPPTTTPNQNVTVPKVIGLRGDQAYQILRSEALNPEPGGVKASRIVIGTSPGPGTSVPKHTTVVVRFR